MSHTIKQQAKASGLSECPVLAGLIRAVKARRSRKGAGSIACPEKALWAKLCSLEKRQSKMHMVKAELLEPKSDRLNHRLTRNTVVNYALTRPCSPQTARGDQRTARASLPSGGLGRNGNLRASNLSLYGTWDRLPRFSEPEWRRSLHITQCVRPTADAAPKGAEGRHISPQQCGRNCWSFGGRETATEPKNEKVRLTDANRLHD